MRLVGKQSKCDGGVKKTARLCGPKCNYVGASIQLFNLYMIEPLTGVSTRSVLSTSRILPPLAEVLSDYRNRKLNRMQKDRFIAKGTPRQHDIRKVLCNIEMC